MDKIVVVKFFIGLLTGILCIVGLLTSMYSFQRKRFYISSLLIAWSLVVIASFMYLYVKRIYDDFISDQIDLKNAVSIYYYTNIVGSLVNYFSHLIQTKAILEYYNSVPIFDTLRAFDMNPKIVRSSALMVFFKIIIFPVIIETNLVLRELRNEHDRNLWRTLYSVFPMIIANFLPNCVFAGFVLCRECMSSLNRQLEMIEKEANFYQGVKQMILHKPFHRMQIYCDLSDKVEHLAEKYAIICMYTLKYMDLNSLPILCSLLSNLFGITAGFFQQYYAIADTMINEESYDLFDAMTNAVFLAISFLEIALLGVVANECLENVSSCVFKNYFC